jgi:Fe2+ transport system protein B
MDFNGLLVLAALWFLLSLLTKAKKKPPRGQQLPGRPPQPRRIPEPLSATDATQREGSRLELVLREFQRALEQAGAVDRPTRLPLPPAGEEEVEEMESLEAEPEVVSLETGVRREARKRVDQDDEAEQIEARRITAAAARDKASSKADHVAFDQRIRPEVADKTATRGHTTRQLQDAVVWREILGPPVSLREE